MEETDDASSVYIIDHGKIVASGSPASLKKEHAPNLLNIYSKTPESVVRFLTDKGYEPTLIDTTVRAIIPNAFDALPLIEALRDTIDNFELVNGRMDDVFIAITGKELRE